MVVLPSLERNGTDRAYRQASNGNARSLDTGLILMQKRKFPVVLLALIAILGALVAFANYLSTPPSEDSHAHNESHLDEATKPNEASLEQDRQAMLDSLKSSTASKEQAPEIARAADPGTTSNNDRPTIVRSRGAAVKPAPREVATDAQWYRDQSAVSKKK